MRGIRLIIIAAAAAAWLMPTQAIASSQDIAATHAYIRANYALSQASEAKVPLMESRVDAYNRKLGQECPSIGAGSLQDEASQPASYEVVVALWSIAYGTDAAPIAAFARAVKGLHWSNPSLTRTAQHYATTLHELATLPMPDLCKDLRAWKATGFQTIPPNVIQADHHAEAIEGKSIPSRLLAPYVQSSDKGVFARTKQLETKLAETEFMVGQTDWILVKATLAVNG